MTPQAKFPPVIDSTMRADFVACPHRFWRRYIQGYQRPGKSIHLHFGGAFAQGLSTLRTSGSLESAVRSLIEAWGDTPNPLAGQSGENKTLERCVGALEAYVSQYPPDRDHLRVAHHPTSGKPLVEFSFAIPLPIRHPTTQEPLLYSGRFDMIANMQGVLVGHDDKTASQLGQSWASQWRLRAQFTGYVWGAKHYGFDLRAFNVRGISILKRGYGHMEVLESRPQWMIDRWYSQLQKDIWRMIDCWYSKQWDQALDHACSDYGACTFIDLCTSEKPEKWLSEFEIQPFDPLNPL